MSQKKQSVLYPSSKRTSGRENLFYVTLVPNHCQQNKSSNKND